MVGDFICGFRVYVFAWHVVLNLVSSTTATTGVRVLTRLLVKVPIGI